MKENGILVGYQYFWLGCHHETGEDFEPYFDEENYDSGFVDGEFDVTHKLKIVNC